MFSLWALVVSCGMGCDLIHTRCKKQRKKINAPTTEKSLAVRKKTLTNKKKIGVLI